MGEYLEHLELRLITNDVIANRPLNNGCPKMCIKGLVSTFSLHQKQFHQMFSFEKGKFRGRPNYEWCLTFNYPDGLTQWCRADRFATIKRMERSLRGGRPCHRHLSDRFWNNRSWLSSIVTAKWVTPNNSNIPASYNRQKDTRNRSRQTHPDCVSSRPWHRWREFLAGIRIQI